MEIIKFNHVSPDLDEETLKTIEDLYIYYHRLSWCNKKNHKVFSMKEKICTYGGIVLIAVKVLLLVD